MTDDKRFSRVEREEKRRNSKRKFLFFASLAVVFCIILFSLIAFGNKETPKTKATSDNTDQLETKIEKNDEENEEDPIQNIEIGDTVEAISDEEEVEIEEVDSNDKNVIKAYTADWIPIGTKQEGPHTTNYTDGSVDRAEIKKAVSKVTGINESTMTEHWVGNGGDQKVISTVQNQETDEYYRVYLTWIDEEGWQATKVEKIHDSKDAKTVD